MAPQTDQLNERFAGTFRKLLDTIERGGEQCSTDRLQTFLEERSKQLSLALDAFGEPSVQSRSKVTGGTSVSVDGRTVNLTQGEKNYITMLSDIFHVNELSCVSLWAAFKQEKKVNVPDDKLCEDIQLLDQVTRFYFDERTCLLQCVASLLRIRDDMDHPFSAIASDIVSRIVKDDFVERVIKQFKKSVRANVPTLFQTRSETASTWANQNLREQKSLLEIMCLIHPPTLYSPQRVLALIQEFEANSFGRHQACNYVLDQEGSILLEEVSHMCVLTSVVILRLPFLRPVLSIQPKGETLLDAPDILVKIGQVAHFLGDRSEHSVFLLAWSYLLSYIEQLFPAEGCPQPYLELQQLINGNLPLTNQQLLRDRPSRSIKLPQTPVIPQSKKTCHTFMDRSLMLHVFDHMSSMLQSRICGVCDEEGADNSGNRQVLKELLNAFLSTLSPISLRPYSYSSLIQCVRLLFLDQSELCLQFWKGDAEKNAFSKLLYITSIRFPCQFTELLNLLSSLAGTRDNTSDSKESARQVFEYLKSLSSLTTVLKSNVNLQLYAEGNELVAFSNDPIRVSRAINQINAFSVPTGTLGNLLSVPDSGRIVQWHINYSGWHLIAAVLANFIERKNAANYDGSEIDIEDEDGMLAGQNIDGINAILELLHKVFQACPALVPELVQHIDEIRSPDVVNDGRHILISLLCDILDICCSVDICPITTTNLALQCITSLLPYYREEIWKYLETAPLLPRPNASQRLSARFPVASRISTDPNCQIQHIVSNVECKKGEYTLLLAFLNLVTALVRDVQRHWWIDPQQSGDSHWNICRQYQVETLYLCLHYLMLDVFPSYANWRYRNLSQRFRIGSKVMSIFIEIAQYFRDPDCAAASKGLSLDQLREDILSNFLYEGGAYHVEPLLEVLSAGAKTADRLYRNQHFGEAKLAEKLTIQTFEFIKILLQRQLEAIACSDTVRESTLERMILERPNGTSTPDFLLRLTRHINYRHNTLIPILATNIVTLLCRTSQTWKNPPDFVRHLGDKEQAQSIIKTYLSVAQDRFQSERMLTSIWQMIILLLETQPSLGLLFLECGENIMPSPKSAVKLLEEQRKQRAANNPNHQQPVESAVRVAVELLNHWEMLSMEKPTVLSNVLRFLATFWQTAFQHHAMVQRTRSDSALWDALGKVLLNPTNINFPRQDSLELHQVENISIDNDMEGAPVLELSSNNMAVRRVCCLNISKAFVLRIMSFEIHLTACAQANATAIAENLPAGLKTLLSKISDPSKLAVLRSSAIKNSFNPLLSKDVNNVAEELLKLISGSDASRLLYKVGAVGYGDNDAEDQPRQYGDLFLYDLRIAEARINSLLKEIADKYHVEEGDNILVTREVLGVQKIKAAANRLKACICLANHNSSLVDSEMILLRSFKIFIETCSGHTSDIFWGSKALNTKSTVLFEFIKSVLQHATDERRDDGVTLTIYATLIDFLRGLTEDWVSSLQDGSTGKSQHIDEIVSLLEGNCHLLRRVNFSLVDSVRGYTAASFHRPLLETCLLLLRTLRKASSGSRDLLSPKVKEYMMLLLDVSCESFQIIVAKATTFIAAGVQGEEAEECVKDCTVITAIVIELINKTYQPDAREWLPAFFRYDTIPSVLRLLHDGIGLAVNEIDSQTSNGSQNLYVSPYAENALYLLLVLSGVPMAAEELLRQGLPDVFCNNPLTPILQQGALDLVIRFNEGIHHNQNQAVYVERNPLHVAWCHMLFIISNMMRSLVDDNQRCDIGNRMLRCTVAFIQMYGAQIQRAFTTAKGDNDSLMSLSPSESLASCQLEEIERITMIMFGLAKRSDRVVSYALSIFIAFGNFASSLLQRYLYFFTHPQHMQAQLYPINHIERQLAEQPISSSLSASTSRASANKASRLLQNITHKIVRIQPNILLTLMLLTDVQKILTQPDVEWPFANTILDPNLRIGHKASLGTMIECINAGLILLKAEHHGKSQQISRGLLYLIEGCCVLLTTQTALWIAKPDITEDVRQQIADDSLIDVVNTVTKLFIGLDKAELPLSLKQEKDRIMIQAESLKRFLTDRYFGTL